VEEADETPCLEPLEHHLWGLFCLSVPAGAGNHCRLPKRSRSSRLQPGLEATRSGVDAARERVGEARAMNAPKVSLAVEDARSDSPMVAFGARLNQGVSPPTIFPRCGSTTLRRPPTCASVPRSCSSVPRRDGPPRDGCRTRRVKVAEHDVERTREAVIFRVIETYLGAILARESVAVAEMACDVSCECVRNASAALEASRTVESDLLQAKVRHSENEENLLQRRNQEALALDGLATLLGVPRQANSI